MWTSSDGVFAASRRVVLCPESGAQRSPCAQWSSRQWRGGRGGFAAHRDRFTGPSSHTPGALFASGNAAEQVSAPNPRSLVQCVLTGLVGSCGRCDYMLRLRRYDGTHDAIERGTEISARSPQVCRRRIARIRRFVELSSPCETVEMAGAADGVFGVSGRVVVSPRQGAPCFLRAGRRSGGCGGRNEGIPGRDRGWPSRIAVDVRGRGRRAPCRASSYDAILTERACRRPRVLWAAFPGGWTRSPRSRRLADLYGGVERKRRAVAGTASEKTQQRTSGCTRRIAASTRRWLGESDEKARPSKRVAFAGLAAEAGRGESTRRSMEEAGTADERTRLAGRSCMKRGGLTVI